MNRRDFLLSSASFLCLTNLASANTLRNPLPILPLKDLTKGFNNKFDLKLKQTKHDFGTGKLSNTYGINRSYLGPVLKVKKGQNINFNVMNGIEENSTLHWHGLHIDGDIDGGPHQEIQPGDTWSPVVPINQRSSMNWFHSHIHGKTAKQVYKGLTGIMLIEDEESISSDLPNSYGVDDFTVVLQDKTFDQKGFLQYKLTENIIEDGFIGEKLVVNGTIAPVTQSVPNGLLRLRILNASNANFLTLSLSKGPINVIASDGGFLPSTVKTDTLFMSPGERYEVLVDMKNYEYNQLLVKRELPELKGVKGILRELIEDGDIEETAIFFNRKNTKGFSGSIPKRLSNISSPEQKNPLVIRNFSLQQNTEIDLEAFSFSNDNCGNADIMRINGKSMNLNRIDEKVKKGQFEIWRITVDDFRHPFHIHGCSFRILKQEGKSPPLYAQGWKDMVHVDGEEWSEVLVRFDNVASENSPFMYHCHILEHEDCGMMGQFIVV